MWELYRMELKYEVCSNLNYFFNFLKKRKFLSSRLPDDFHYTGIKQFAYGFSLIYKILKTFVKGSFLAYLAFFMYLALIGFMGKTSTPDHLQSFFFILYLLTNLVSSAVLEAGQKMHFFHEVFRQPAREVGRVELILGSLMDGLGRLFGLSLVLTLLGGVPWVNTLFLALLVTCVTLVMEYIHLRLFDRDIPLAGNVIATLGLLFVTLVLLIFTVYFEFTLPALFNNHWLILPAAAAALLALRGCWHYDGYQRVARFALDKYEKQLEVAAGINLRTQDVKLRETDLTADDDSVGAKSLARLNGYDKLNALFFQRHRRILAKPVRIATGIALLIGLAGLVTALLDRRFHFLQFPEFGWVYDSTVSSLLPYFLYGSIGSSRLTKSLFVNCDSSLLSYGFYRRSDDILKSFNIRLKHVLRLNLPLPVALLITHGIWLFMTDMKVTPARLLLFIMIIAYFLFFSIHLLTTYYLLQPYTSDVQVKSPLYSVLNFAVYLFCYLPIFLQPDLYVLALTMIGLTVLYGIAARILIPRLAPRTFHLK